MASDGFVYIMSNRQGGTLYVGVTNSLARRVMEHRSGTGASFVRRYNLHRLVYVECHEEIARAIEREKQIKHWNRSWKVRLIEEQNPHWDDLFDRINM